MTTHHEERPLEQWVKEYANDPEFIAEGLSTDVIEEVLAKLKERGLTQRWLAQTMGVSRAHVSRMFSSPPNLTFLSLARLAIALGGKPRILLNEADYFIRLLDQTISYEEFATDQAIAIIRRSRLGSDTQATVNPIVNSQSGAFSNAAT